MADTWWPLSLAEARIDMFGLFENSSGVASLPYCNPPEQKHGRESENSADEDG